MNYNFRKQNILELPFDDKDFLSSALAALGSNADWIIPQAQRFINRDFSLLHNITGLIDPQLTINAFAVNHPDKLNWYKGLFSWLNISPRSGVTYTKQVGNPNHSALVPLILAAFKIHREVGYSEWDWKHPYMKVFVDQDILDACTKYPYIIPTKEEILSAREYSLQIKSGKRVGENKNPTSQYSVTSRAFGSLSEYNDLPRLRKIMLCQLWVAHPLLRTDLMILDVNNKDEIPLPLVEESFNTTKYVAEEEKELSWT